MDDPHHRLPYPGLRAFDRDEADLFFGRDGAVNELVDKLADTGFLAVIGASGTGKSSLVRTGLLDGLELGLHPAGSHWQFAIFMPGGQPITNLARALIAAEAEARGEETPANNDGPLGQVAMMEGLLRRGPKAVSEWLETSAIPESAHLLLLVDQFEELFRFDTYAAREDAEAFVNLLIQSSQVANRRIHVVITMRSEFLGACALIPRLAETLNRGNYLTPRMSRRECRMAIVGPARIVGAEVEDALVNRLLNDLSSFAPWGREANTTRLLDLTRRADQLPVMQHLLNRMWQQAQAEGDDTATLTLAQYTELGGLRGALDTHGDEVLSQFQGADRDKIERLFRALVDGPNPAAAIRRPRTLAELAHELGTTEDDVLRLISPFRAQDCNFLRPGVPLPITSDTVIDISHESLIRQWSRMSAWVEAEARAARDWIRLESYQRRYAQGLEELLNGRALSTLSNWWQDEDPKPEWAARYIRIDEDVRQDLRGAEDERAHVLKRFEEISGYLKDSEANEENARDRAKRTRRWFQAAGGAVTVLSLAVGGVSYFALQSQREANESQLQALESQRQALESRQQQRELFTGTVERVVQETTTALDREFQSPTQSKLDTIELGNQLLSGLEAQRDREWEALSPEERESAEQQASARWFVERRMSFLMKSVAVKLSGGMLEQSGENVDELNGLLERVLAEPDWTPAAIRLGEAELLLARFARLRTDFGRASSLLNRAESRLSSQHIQIGPDAVHLAELLHERAMIHHDQRRTGAQLQVHRALRAHLDPLLVRQVWDEIKYRNDPSMGTRERAQLNRLLRRVYLVSVRSGMAAMLALHRVDGHQRGGHDPARLLAQVTGWVGWLRDNVGLTDPETRLALVRLSLVEAVATRDFDLDILDAADPNAAVARAVGLVDYDPSNIAFMRNLVETIMRRAGYALDAVRLEQAQRDISDARTLIHVLRQLNADPGTLVHATTELDFLEWRYHWQADAPGPSAAVAARLRARTLFHQGLGTLDGSVHDVATLRMTAAEIISAPATGPGIALSSDSIDGALARFPITSADPDDSYYALKMRQVIYGSLLGQPIDEIGVERWLSYHEAATAELDQLIAAAPDALIWRRNQMDWHAQAWLTYWSRGTPGDETQSYVELARALNLAVGLFRDEPDRRSRIGYIRLAAHFATDLVQMLHRAEDPDALLPPLDAFANDVLTSGITEVFNSGEVQFDRGDRPSLRDFALALSVAVLAHVDDENPAVLRVLGTLSRALDTARLTLDPESNRTPGVRNDRINRPTEFSPPAGAEAGAEPHAGTPRGTGGPLACGTAQWAFEPLYPAAWRTLDQPGCEAAIARDLAAVLSPMLLDKIELIRETQLPFYRDGTLIEVQMRVPGDSGGQDTLLASYLKIDGETYALTGSIRRLLDVSGSSERTIDTPAVAAAYMRFFLLYMNGNEGAFQIVETVRDIAWTRAATPGDLAEAGSELRPLVVWAAGEDRWRATTSIHYGQRVYHADLLLGPDGVVNVTNDVPVTGPLPTQPVFISARAAGHGIRAFGLPAPAEEQLAVNGVNLFDLLGLDEGNLVESFEDEVHAVIRATLVSGDSNRAMQRHWLEEHVAMVADPAVLGAGDPASRAAVLGKVAEPLALYLPDGDPLLAQAVAFAETAGGDDPDREVQATTLGLALVRTGETARAIELLDAVIANAPVPSMDALLYLGRAHLTAGDLDAAERATRDGLGEEPNDRRNLRRLRSFADETLTLIAAARTVQ